MWVENPDDFNRQVTREQWEAQVYRCARRIPSLPIPEEMKGVVDLYDCSDDWIPIYDKSDLRRLLHGRRHERQPVQERPGRRATAWPS